MVANVGKNSLYFYYPVKIDFCAVIPNVFSFTFMFANAWLRNRRGV